MRVDIYHGILWSKYKAVVFSEIHRLACDYELSVDFYQMAESDTERASLSGVDISVHRYPYILLFKGAYSKISKPELISTLFRRVYRADAELVLLPGFSEFAHWGMLFGAILSRKKRAVFCDATLYDRPQSQIKGCLKRLYFALCNGFFTYGQRGREYLVHYGADPSIIFQRVQAAALPGCYSPENARQARIAAVRSPDAPIFLYVGRLSEEKSVDVLIQSFKRVASRLPKSTLRIVGGGPQRDDLIVIARELGVTSSVVFVGGLDLDALAGEYARATCLVLPSNSEPWGVVVNEALHFGCPVVVSDRCGCVPELVASGVTGLTFAVGDVSGLTECLFQALRDFSDIGKTMEDCLAVVSKFGPEQSARQTLSGCRQLLGAGT